VTNLGRADVRRRASPSAKLNADLGMVGRWLQLQLQLQLRCRIARHHVDLHANAHKV
jgi:hypothetical protein